MARNFDEVRPVKITIATAISTDAHKAVIHRVEKLEAMYDADPASVTDVTAQKVVLTGNTPYKIFVFNLTLVIATGDYTFAYVKENPNVEAGI